jgi:RimJ/RimL family protein N-acetyltransferase
VEPEIRLLSRGQAERVAKGPQARNAVLDAPWAPGYPLEGDTRACAAYLSQLQSKGAETSTPFGYYQVLVDGVVVGGIGFHGPPVDGVVEIGYGVVPSARGQGVATNALRLLLDLAGEMDGVRRVCGRTTEDNVPSQRVMVAAGMQVVGRDPDFLHYELELDGG